MSEVTEVEVEYGDDASVTAQNLLAAAERLGEPAFVVKTTTRGVFIVPSDVADEAAAFAEGTGVEVQTNEPETDVFKLGKAELDKIAADEDIDLTGHKGSNAAKAQRISDVRAERLAAKLEEEAAASEAQTSEEDPDEAKDDSGETVAADENKE